MREKLKVQLVQWPINLPIQHPKNFKSMDDLHKICVAFRTGTAFWAPLTTAERKQVTKDIEAWRERGEPDKEPHAERSDKGKTRGKQAGSKKGKQAGTKRKSAGKENPAASKRACMDRRNSESSHAVYKSQEFVASDVDDDVVEDDADVVENNASDELEGSD